MKFHNVKRKKRGEKMTKTNKVRGYRNMLGLSQEKLGAKLGCSKQAYHNKENGRNAFTDAEKMTFKKLLLPMFPNITLEDIFF